MNDKKSDKKNASPSHGRAGQQQRQPDKKPEVDDDGFVVQVLLSSELHVCAGLIVFFYMYYMCCVWCRCLHSYLCHSSSLWLGWCPCWCPCWCLPPSLSLLLCAASVAVRFGWWWCSDTNLLAKDGISRQQSSAHPPNRGPVRRASAR